MPNIAQIVAAPAPHTLQEARNNWPDRNRHYHPSPMDWRDEILYFILPDRFSDGQEGMRPMLPADLSTAAGQQALAALRGPAWNWQQWCLSGNDRFQGGTLKGIQSKLPYLQGLGVTTLWIAPIFRQRVEVNSYHGYGVQNFFDIDSRFGSRADLVALVDAAHQRGMRIMLDVIFNHSGCNWLYDLKAGDAFKPPYLPSGAYDTIWPRSGLGTAIQPPFTPAGSDDYVWPLDLRGPDKYLRAGKGDLGKGAISDENAEHKRTDFEDLRKFNLWSEALGVLIWIYNYWMALADIDGLRIDTLKHVTFKQARDFCNAIAEYAEVLGKDNFFLLAEVAGGDQAQEQYLQITGRNLSACLDIGGQRMITCEVAKGLADPASFFNGFSFDDAMGSKRNWGSLHVSVSNDHDHVFGEKIRLAADAPNDHLPAVAAALQFFSLGIPCIYYGTEQNLASGVPAEERQWIPAQLPWGSSDYLLRETMFGPQHPRASGYPGTTGQFDAALPGFGPHGTVGHHAFNAQHPTYARIQHMAAVRAAYKPLRRGRQYRRATSCDHVHFSCLGSGDLLAWSRVFDDQEVLIVVNTNGCAAKCGQVIIDTRLCSGPDPNAPEDRVKVAYNSDPAASVGCKTGEYRPFGSGSFIDIPSLGPSEVMVLVSKTAEIAAGRVW